MSNDQAILALGTIMGVWAHPDDETFMTGGIMSMAAANGQQVICVTATKGEAGVQDESKWPASELAQIREQELADALDILGASNHHWLDYQDGHCAGAEEAIAVSQVAALIDQYKPDTIISFPPHGLTGHPDHQAVSEWARLAAEQATHDPQLYHAVQTRESYDSFWRDIDRQFNIYFATQEPELVPILDCNLHIYLEPTVVARKTAALKAMPSQSAKLFEFLGENGVGMAVGAEALVIAK